jgi:hypothetical protein
MVKGYQLDRDLYLELRAECYEAILDTTLEGVTAIPECEIEKRCDEAVGEHDLIGEIDQPRVNAAILVVALKTNEALEDIGSDPSFESASEFLATLAHTAVKYDLVTQILDEQAEAERHD